MATGLVCSSSRNGIPDGCKKGNPILSMAGFYAITKGTTISYANFCDNSAMLDLVIAKTLLPAHSVFSIEDMSTEKIVEESNIGRKKTNHLGFRGYKVTFDYTPDQHQALLTWANSNIDIIPYDIAGNIYAAAAATGYVKGFGIEYFDVEKLGVPSPESGMKSVLEIQETDPTELEDFKYIKPSKFTAVADRWSPEDVKTISLATLTQVGSITANVFVVTAALVSNAEIKDDALTSAAVTGLLIGNFTVKDGSGNAVTPDSVTETSGTPGEYTVDCTGTGYTGGTVTLLAVNTDEKLYESNVLTLT